MKQLQEEALEVKDTKCRRRNPVSSKVLRKVWRSLLVLVSATMLTAANAFAQTQTGEQGTLPVSPPTTESQPLELPPLTGPQLPPAPPALESPVIPTGLLGCWEGNPGKFDTLGTDAGIVGIGTPGKIVFCYYENRIDIPEADVIINPKGRVLDVLLHLGLGFSTYKAHGVSTDIFSVTQSSIHARTQLDIVMTEHWLYVIPSHTDEPSQVDEFFTLKSPDTALIQAQQVIFLNGLKMWGTWHGDFHRLAIGEQP
jgi:hypothetical protein